MKKVLLALGMVVSVILVLRESRSKSKIKDKDTSEVTKEYI
jgi:hypothetical protein